MIKLIKKACAPDREKATFLTNKKQFLGATKRTRALGNETLNLECKQKDINLKVDESNKKLHLHFELSNSFPYLEVAVFPAHTKASSFFC